MTESHRQKLMMFWRGRKRGPMSEQQKEVRRKTMLERWKDPDYQARRKAAHTKAMNDPNWLEMNRKLAMARKRNANGQFLAKGDLK